MNEAIVLTGILIFIFGGFFLLNKFYRNRPVADDHHDHAGDDGVCCGRHANCSKGRAKRTSILTTKNSTVTKDARATTTPTRRLRSSATCFTQCRPMRLRSGPGACRHAA